jgi:beta-glucosidase-like glycosyl hydrolase
LGPEESRKRQPRSFSTSWAVIGTGRDLSASNQGFSSLSADPLECGSALTWDRVRAAKWVNALQRYLVTETRLGIPAIFHNEALNGVVSPHFTAFPTPIGLAATWDPSAVEEMADIMRRQMRAVGLLHALVPVMDVARDARWGRVIET